MADFKPAFEHTLELEGGYSDDASDPGGKTNYGITEALARPAGYVGDMRLLSRRQAEAIYRSEFWEPMRLGELQSQKVAEELFDTAVNCGKSRAGRWLQEALNVLNDKGRRWPDIEEDGNIGPKTIAVTNRATDVNRVRLLKALNVLQGAHYIGLARKDQKFERFVGGWLDKRIGLH